MDNNGDFEKMSPEEIQEIFGDIIGFDNKIFNENATLISSYPYMCFGKT